MAPSSPSGESITGIYDVVLAVRPSELAETVAHYQEFGYGEPSPEGSLSADEAEVLYGHRSSVRSVRLPHQESDHGLLVRHLQILQRLSILNARSPVPWLT
jgi:hypothetical protein